MTQARPIGATPSQEKPLFDMSQARPIGAGQPKILGHDMFGDIPDNLYTRTGARIKANLDIPKQIPAVADAITAGIKRIKEGGWQDALKIVGSHDSQMPAFLDALKDTVSKPENLIGDAITGYIFGQAGEGLRGETSKLVDQHLPPEGETYRANLETKAAIEQHLETGNVDGAQKALDAVRDAGVPKKAPTQYRNLIPGVGVRPSVERLQSAAPEAPTPAPAVEAAQPPAENEPPTESSPRPKATPEQIRELNEKFRPFLEQAIKEHEAEKTSGVKAAATVPIEEDLTPQLQEMLRQIQARKAFLDQNSTHP